MKVEIRRKSICIMPENELEHAFIEDILGVKQDGATISFRRYNEVPLGYKPKDDSRFSLIGEKNE